MTKIFINTQALKNSVVSSLSTADNQLRVAFTYCDYMVIPDYIKEYMNKIIDNGYECYLVGGAVRDYILGVDNKDYDFCTNMPMIKLKDILPINIMKENDHRNTGIIRSNEYDLEFSLFRGNNLYEDLSNRDYSINAIATDINGNYFDYFSKCSTNIIVYWNSILDL